MSAGKVLGQCARWLLVLLASLVGWLLVAPVAMLVPKRRNWVAVIGRQDGRFLDNAKYFFLQVAQDVPELRLVFVTERNDVVDLLEKQGLKALYYPGWESVYYLLRCNCVVVDEVAWYGKWRAFLLIRAHVVQLWHGVGCKWIEAGLWAHEVGFKWISGRWVQRLRMLVYRMTRRRLRYAAVATTSRFYRDEVFAPAFIAHHFPVTGYPRNDFALSLNGKFRDLAWSNVDPGIRGKLEEWKRHGRKLVLIAPTFRDKGGLPMQLGDAELWMMDEFAEVNGIEFVFKFHPSERNVDRVAGRHFHVCARDSDIYPLLPQAEALITDYSSIGMDFLLVDRPMLFLIPEGDDYARKDRLLQFDPHSMMPGPVVASWPALLEVLIEQWAGDGYVRARGALRHKAFDEEIQADAVPKIISLMRRNGWILKE